MKKSFLLLLLIPTIVSCQADFNDFDDSSRYSSRYQRSSRVASARDLSISSAQIENAIFNRVNRYRQKKGLPPLVRSKQLDAMAKAHSIRMMKENNLNHNGFDNRANKAQSLGFNRVTENVAFSENVSKPATTALEGWRDSPGHNRNMLDFKVSATGVGVVVKGGIVYSTQLFGGAGEEE